MWSAPRGTTLRYLLNVSNIPLICPFWYTATLSRPVKSTPKKHKVATNQPKLVKMGHNFTISMLWSTSARKKVHHRRLWRLWLIWAMVSKCTLHYWHDTQDKKTLGRDKLGLCSYVIASRARTLWAEKRRQSQRESQIESDWAKMGWNEWGWQPEWGCFVAKR